MPESLSPIEPFALTAQALSNPIGLGVGAPVLRWKLRSKQPCQRSVAFEVQASATLSDLLAGSSLLLATDWIEETAVQSLPYAGQSLDSRAQCHWRVRVRDAEGRISAWSEPAFFELGLLESHDWTARWIASPIQGGPRTCPAAPYFRKAFTLTKPIASARLYATALGLFEGEINGQPVSECVFAPGWTDYRQRVQTLTLDVASLLREGENSLGVILGEGWHTGHLAGLDREFYGEKSGLMAQLEVTHPDGSRTVIGTDADWRTSPGPILSNDLIMGEHYDARRELGPWSKPGFDDSNWEPVLMASPPAIALNPTAGPFVRRHEILPAKTPGDLDAAETGWKGSNQILDFGQNLVGRVRITLRGERGTTVRLRHAEMLESNGALHLENLRTAAATDYYTLKGEGLEVFEPRFTFHGFRYVEVNWKGKPEKVNVEKVEAVVLHSEIPATGHFACSHPLLNQLQSNIDWGQRGNFLDIPTDCPQRDERLGWTGDAQVFIRTACYNRDVQAFFHKWMRDVRDAQRPNGGVPIVVPDIFGGEGDGGPAWSDATIICPWTIYHAYGDKQILADHYDSMRRYVDCLVSKSQDLIRCHPDVDSWGGFGDWLAIDGSGATSGRTLKDLIGTAFLAHDARLLAEISTILAKPVEAEEYQALFKRVRSAFNRRFVTAEGYLAGETQTAYILALHFDLLPEALRPAATEHLVRLIRKNKKHLATGFVGTPYICKVLETQGHLDLAYHLLENETYPSWLFSIRNGATTVWERWDSWTPEHGFHKAGMNSFNHYAYGAIGAWMFGTVAGLEYDPEQPGGRSLIFRPRPGGSLSWAEAKLETPYGLASIRWEKAGADLRLALEVPVNAAGRLDPPPGYTSEVRTFAPGRHELTLELQKT